MDLETLESLSEHDEHRNGSDGWGEPPADDAAQPADGVATHAPVEPDDEGETVASDDAAEELAAAEDAEAETEGLDAIVESLLLASGGPVPLARLVEALAGPSRREVTAALATLAARYERENRGLRLIEVAGGFQLRTAPQHGPWVRRLLGGRPPRLSRPMLETLAIIAYRQPCTRPEIEAVRGVDCDAVVSTLIERRLIRMLGRKEAPGRPLLYGTTREFLEVFGLPDLRSLPPLRDLGDGVELLMSQDLTVGPDGVHPTPVAEERDATDAEAAGASSEVAGAEGGEASLETATDESADDSADAGGLEAAAADAETGADPGDIDDDAHEQEAERYGD